MLCVCVNACMCECVCVRPMTPALWCDLITPGAHTRYVRVCRGGPGLGSSVFFPHAACLVASPCCPLLVPPPPSASGLRS